MAEVKRCCFKHDYALMCMFALNSPKAEMNLYVHSAFPFKFALLNRSIVYNHSEAKARKQLYGNLCPQSFVTQNGK